MNCTDTMESDAALTELIAKYHAIQGLKIDEVNAFGRQSETAEYGKPQAPELALKRFLSIFSERIFDSSVDRGMPNLAAAPVGPKTCPRLSFKAASIIFFSCATSFRGSSI